MQAKARRFSDFLTDSGTERHRGRGGRGGGEESHQGGAEGRGY